MQRQSLPRRTTPLRRSPIKRHAPRVPQSDPSLFEIETKHGDRYLWPVKWMPEEGGDGWRATVEGWALFGDRDTKLWHAQTSETTRSQPGWFDDSIFQPNRRFGVMVELKVRDREGGANNPSPWQWGYITAALACGFDVRVWTWPDDAREAFEALTDYDYSAYLRGQLVKREMAP